ncbi:MAG: Rpp14/Pop5 family protein [Nitrososphaerota archaeon]|nr:Rpp14/Pop5 family protein [Aigarchaeota archaeon]MDW8076399.1 Rpp14/Pop5 family protein [Nitrososphaerota archaeon]
MLRNRYRYVFVRHFPRDVKLDKSEIWKAILSSLQHLVGALGYADVNPYLVKVQKDIDGLVIRCNSKQVRTLVAAIALVNSVGGERISLDVKKVSGTLKALLKKLKC